MPGQKTEVADLMGVTFKEEDDSWTEMTLASILELKRAGKPENLAFEIKIVENPRLLLRPEEKTVFKLDIVKYSHDYEKEVVQTVYIGGDGVVEKV